MLTFRHLKTSQGNENKVFARHRAVRHRAFNPGYRLRSSAVLRKPLIEHSLCMLLYDAWGLEPGGDCRLKRAAMAGAVNFQFADDDLNAFFAAPVSDGQAACRARRQ